VEARENYLLQVFTRDDKGQIRSSFLHFPAPRATRSDTSLSRMTPSLALRRSILPRLSDRERERERERERDAVPTRLSLTDRALPKPGSLVECSVQSTRVHSSPILRSAPLSSPRLSVSLSLSLSLSLSFARIYTASAADRGARSALGLSPARRAR